MESLKNTAPVQAIDSFGRAHTYLRVSVTDKCNLSCRYCAPGDNLSCFSSSPIPHPSSLGCVEILRLIRTFAALGIEKVRFTGGEPLLHPDIERLVAGAKAIPGIKKVCLTTNGVLLENKAEALRAAGLDALNVSLDSLDAGRFKKITGSGSLAAVRTGIDRALSLDFKLKINAVALSDLSSGEVDGFVKFSAENRLTVRFIELMPFCDDNFSRTAFAPISRIERYLAQKYAAGPSEVDGVARNYKINGGVIGFISALSHPLCGSCNRLRLSSRGVLYRCLFDSSGLDLKTLRDENEKRLPEHIRKFLAGKRQSHAIGNAGPAGFPPETDPPACFPPHDFGGPAGCLAGAGTRMKNSMRLMGG